VHQLLVAAKFVPSSPILVTLNIPSQRASFANYF
jgi:hypothetical protein